MQALFFTPPHALTRRPLALYLQRIHVNNGDLAFYGTDP